MTIVAEGDARPLVDALAAFARRFDIEVIEPTVLSISSNVVIHLRPAPVVARVANITAVGRDRPDRALEREIVLADHLLDEGVPTIEPSDLLPPGPHELDGRWASFFTYEKLTPVGDEDAERVGHACVDLLAAAASYGDGDGLFDRSLRDEADVLLERLVGRVAEADLALLRAGADAAFVAAGGSVQPIHADAHRGNVGPGRRARSFGSTSMMRSWIRRSSTWRPSRGRGPTPGERHANAMASTPTAMSSMRS
jgi:hypothetical protein